jgi:tetrahydrodipicolinate N-succinyltransferase
METDALMLFVTANKSMYKVETMLVDRTAQLYLHAVTANHSPELKMITQCAVRTHVLKHQGEDKLEVMVLARNVEIIRSSSMANAREQHALQTDTTLLEMVNVFNAKDTKK